MAKSYRWRYCISKIICVGFPKFKQASWIYFSHDCVARVRRLTRLKRVGHGGTLDPAGRRFADRFGRATRLLQFLQPDKVYKATIQLGITTATDDLEGEIITSVPASELSLQWKQRLNLWGNNWSRSPPSYSAIQVQGKRLYDLARSRKLKFRRVQSRCLKWKFWPARWGFFRNWIAIACGAGTCG